MEIERKFLVKNMPDLSGIIPVRYERYYLKRDGGVEERIQKKNDKYEYEFKKEVSGLERTVDKKSITESEFNDLKNKAEGNLIRDSYQVSLRPNISIKIYHGRFDGLIRAEVEFDSLDSAKDYIPETWMGEEITDSPLGRDSRLLGLSEQEFKSLII